MGFRVGGKIGGESNTITTPPPWGVWGGPNWGVCRGSNRGCLSWPKLGCLGWLKLGCLGWAKLGCLSWFKPTVETLDLWGVSQLEDAPQQGVGNNTITAPLHRVSEVAASASRGYWY